MRAALVQLTSGDDPEENLSATIGWLRQAALGGADLILTPEVTNCVSTSRETQRAVLQFEEDDKTLSAIRLEAKRLKKWILIGSLALKTTDADGRFANRSFMIDPNGEIRARYDKIHMFDVDVSETETYRESAGFRPGSQAIACETPLGIVGMTICYDLRFPALHRSLAEAGAQILTIPAAFSPVTGEAHWDVLLRARAIETGCFVLAPAQTGSHAQTSGKERKTYGHSMAISPWGEIILDAGTDESVTFVDIDINDVAKARQRIPSLKHARAYESPNV